MPYSIPLGASVSLPFLGVKAVSDLVLEVSCSIGEFEYRWLTIQGSQPACPSMPCWDGRSPSQYPLGFQRTRNIQTPLGGKEQRNGSFEHSRQQDLL